MYRSTKNIETALSKDALQRLGQLEKTPIFTLKTLWQLQCDEDPEILCILNYLKYDRNK